jgi:hypothetical protein
MGRTVCTEPQCLYKGALYLTFCWYGMIYFLTAIGLSPGGSTHLRTNNTQNNTNNNRTTQITNNVEECGPCPVFASFTLPFALQLRKKHGKTSVRVRKSSVSSRNTSLRERYTYYQNTHTLQNPHKQTHYNPPPTHTHIKIRLVTHGVYCGELQTTTNIFDI